MNEAQYNKIKAAVLRYTNKCSIELQKPEYQSFLNDLHGGDDISLIGGGTHPMVDEETGLQAGDMTYSDADPTDYLNFTECFLEQLIPPLDDINHHEEPDSLVDWRNFHVEVHGWLGKNFSLSFYQEYHGDQAERLFTTARDRGITHFVNGKQGIQQIIDYCKKESTGDSVHAKKMQTCQKLFEVFSNIYDYTIGQELEQVRGSNKRGA